MLNTATLFLEIAGKEKRRYKSKNNVEKFEKPKMRLLMKQFVNVFTTSSLDPVWTA